jgi:glycosyltransferase involved in cell wall biosynthesis
MKILYSIITTVYNAENTIHDSLYSVLNQKHASYEFELIIVNDGSTDRTNSILEDLANLYPNVRIISQENKGISKSIDIALKSSSGQYIIFLDSDDYLQPNYLRSIDEILSKEKFDCIQFSMLLNYSSYIKIQSYRNFTTKNKEEIKTFFLKNYNPSLAIRVFKKELFLNIEFLPISFGADEVIFLQIVDRIKSLKVIDLPLYKATVQRSGSVSNEKYSLIKLEKLVIVYKFLINFSFSQANFYLYYLLKKYIGLLKLYKKASSELIHSDKVKLFKIIYIERQFLFSMLKKVNNPFLKLYLILKVFVLIFTL